MRNSDNNNTRMWIFCDVVQYCTKLFWMVSGHLNEFESVMSILKSFKSYFLKAKDLMVNLRNTFEISAVLSIIREYYEEIHCTGTRVVKSPQGSGHFMRGSKAVFYVIRDEETTTWRDILIRELEKLRGSDSCLANKDIAVLVDVFQDEFEFKFDVIDSVLKRWKSTAEDKITFHLVCKCLSAEWAGVIGICNLYLQRSNSVTLPISYTTLHKNKKARLNYIISLLYIVISRARVYSTVILYNYKPKLCEYTDELLNILKQRHDVCKVIEQ